MFKKSAEERNSARIKRIERWSRPISGTTDRILTWLNMIFLDHGFFRLIYLNKHKIDDKLFRAAQPWPHHVRAFARQGGKTIVYLRAGSEHGSWPLENEAADQAGLKLVDFIARSREAPSKAMLLAAPAFFENLHYPAMIHCKSGADRAGIVAAIYVLVHLKRPANEALKQLSAFYGHFRMSKTGVLDRFIETYRDEGEAKGIPFIEWVENHYDPVALQKSFEANFWSNLLVDRILRRE